MKLLQQTENKLYRQDGTDLENEEKIEEIDHPQTEKLFESDSNNEEEDFEIPAFLRRQKF